jgi:hypothetical protein
VLGIDRMFAMGLVNIMGGEVNEKVKFEFWWDGL